MLIAVLLFSLFPYVLAIGNADKGPFLFIALIELSGAVIGLVFLIWFHRTKKNQTAKETLRAIYPKIYTKGFLLLSISRFSGVFFAMSLAYINVAVASILMATEAVIMAAFSARLFSKVGRYQKITAQKWSLLALAFIGVGFVLVSRSENFGEIMRDLTNQGAIVGILLVLLSALTVGMGTPYSLKLGSDISKEASGGLTDEFFFTMAILVATWFVGSLVFIILAHTANESITDINIYPAVGYGCLAFLGAALSRSAFMKTTNLGISAIRYLIPLLSLIWLGLSGLLNVPHFDWLIIGTAAIIIANLLLNFKTNIRPTHKVLIISLWLSATLTYLISA